MGVLLRRTFGVALIGGVLALTCGTTLLAGLGSAPGLLGVCAAFSLGLALWGPFAVVGVHVLAFPGTGSTGRVRSMRRIVWAMALVSTCVAACLVLFSGDPLRGAGSAPAMYLFLVGLSAAVCTALIQPYRRNVRG